jgi:hypothetical protein
VIFEGSGDTTTKHNNYGRLERERERHLNRETKRREGIGQRKLVCHWLSYC